MPHARAHQGDTLDALCYRVLGRTDGVTEQALDMNPGLAELGPILPHGTLVTLPEEQRTPAVVDTVQLWT
ncbi:tail protein X [Halomonas urumqiensis]|uniref:Phage tail protein n=1 Tax=Halomonas urumqiensis TaxID=1684789 RepID=A0A2N7UDP1_9GAMM|nr:tail protein X [Halomonas urumqiensis]PMR78537.1 phage tail protein [Halomonas urumqiensis]PTB03682.1 phage tail protein [Halomonas urumqiensis]GHE20105.1 tail protein X [Halomonas urumqiensis]